MLNREYSKGTEKPYTFNARHCSQSSKTLTAGKFVLTNVIFGKDSSITWGCTAGEKHTD